VHGRDGWRASLRRIQYVWNGFKTGGKDYLLHFLQAKSIAEKVV